MKLNNSLYNFNEHYIFSACQFLFKAEVNHPILALLPSLSCVIGDQSTKKYAQ